MSLKSNVQKSNALQNNKNDSLSGSSLTDLTIVRLECLKIWTRSSSTPNYFQLFGAKFELLMACHKSSCLHSRRTFCKFVNNTGKKFERPPSKKSKRFKNWAGKKFIFLTMLTFEILIFLWPKLLFFAWSELLLSLFCARQHIQGIFFCFFNTVRDAPRRGTW